MNENMQGFDPYIYIYIKEPGDEVKKKNLISVHNKLV